ncbi:hypothetical protein ACV566_14430 [Staphylococcus aureus]
MLLRASNAVGYELSPDNVIHKLVQESAKAGIDAFRIFDSLNWIIKSKIAQIKQYKKRAKSLKVLFVIQVTF